MTTLIEVRKYKFLQKSLVVRGKVIAIQKAEYGEGKKLLTAGIADNTACAKVLVYNEELFGKFQIDRAVAMHNIIKRTDGALVLTQQSKAFLCNASFACTEELAQQAKLLVHPPPAPQVSLQEGLKAKARTTISIRGLIVQEDQEREVFVGKTTPTKVKDIYLKDQNVDRVKVTLWRESCDAPFHPGDYVQINDVVTSDYKGETSFSLTSRSTIQACDPPTTSDNLEIESISINDDMADVLTTDNKLRSVPYEMLKHSLPVKESQDVEDWCIQNAPFRIQVTQKGNIVLEIKYVKDEEQ